MLNCLCPKGTRVSTCDTCGNTTCQGCAVSLSLGNKADDYVECPSCVAERAEYEEHGPKTVSVKSMAPDLQPRLAPGMAGHTTMWADGMNFRFRQWRKRGPA